MAGVRGDQLEDVLASHGLTVGHYPQSIASSTVGGWIAASSAGQASTGFGAIEDVLLGCTAVLPDGGILRCRPVPRSAAGPDLRRLLVGSEGTLAVVTEATLACRARPASWDWLVFGFPTFPKLADGLRDGIRDALAPHSQAVLCHLSHWYSSGSSLYFTFLISGTDDRDAETRYLAAWHDAVRSCAAAGGTLTHHHGVGRLKAAFLPGELGEAGMDVLKKIKAALDPARIMNPGALLP